MPLSTTTATFSRKLPTFIILVLCLATGKHSFSQAYTCITDSLISIASDSGAIANGDAIEPDVAYNPSDNIHLVVWLQNESGLNDLYETYGRLVEASGGTYTYLGDPFKISDFTPDVGRSSEAPAVAYGDLGNERVFLVTWTDDRLSDERREIFGQFINLSLIHI